MRKQSVSRKGRQCVFSLVEQLESRTFLAADLAQAYPLVDSAPVAMMASIETGNSGSSSTLDQVALASAASAPTFNLSQTLSDQAQRTTLLIGFL